MNEGERVHGLVDWIQDTVMSAGCRGVVLGLSGGLDSSVLGVLCQRAFPKNILGLIMPCYSNDQDKEHAEMVARQYDIPTKIVGLKAVYDALLYVLPDAKPEPDRARLAQANLKARLSPEVYPVPLQIDEEVGRLKLLSMGITIDKLTPQQRQYLESWELGT